LTCVPFRLSVTLNAMNEGDVQAMRSDVFFSPTLVKSARGDTWPKSIVLPPSNVGVHAGGTIVPVTFSTADDCANA